MFAALFRKSVEEKPWEALEEGRKSWQEMNAREQEAVVCHYAPKVRFLAQQQKVRLPFHVEFSDLQSAGMLGLVEALGKYRADAGTRFSTYAEDRICGAITDELRRRDPHSRGVRCLMKKISAESEKFEHEYGRQPSEKELCRLTGLSESDVRTGLRAMEQQLSVDISQLAECLSQEDRESGGTPYASASRKEQHAILLSLLAELPSREQFILTMSYLEECSLKEIGEVLGISEGRVSQLRTQTLKRLNALYIERFGR